MSLLNLMVVCALLTPAHHACGAVLPVHDAATSEDGERRTVGTNKANAERLDGSVEDDRIPARKTSALNETKNYSTYHLP